MAAVEQIEQEAIPSIVFAAKRSAVLPFPKRLCFPKGKQGRFAVSAFFHNHHIQNGALP